MIDPARHLQRALGARKALGSESEGTVEMSQGCGKSFLVWIWSKGHVKGGYPFGSYIKESAAVTARKWCLAHWDTEKYGPVTEENVEIIKLKLWW